MDMLTVMGEKMRQTVAVLLSNPSSVLMMNPRSKSALNQTKFVMESVTAQMDMMKRFEMFGLGISNKCDFRS